MEQSEQILRLQSLFRGNSRIIGLASSDLVPEKDGKLNQTRRGFAPGPATATHWKHHLEGRESLGLVPINDHQEVKFMAIDVDLDIMEELKVTLLSLCQKVEQLGFPFVVCRSKSGAAHLYLFLKDLVAVAPVRKVMMAMAEFMGLTSTSRSCEFFPHTNRLDKDSNGKYINLPYFDADNTVRYALSADGQPLSLDEFLFLAESKTISATKLCEWKKELAQAPDEIIKDVISKGPPCLETIYQQGLQDGAKNDILFQFGILFKKHDPKTMADNVSIVNLTRCDNPHDESDLKATLKGVIKKTYHYSCSNPCMSPLCAKSLCMTRKYGIRPVVDFPEVKELIQWGASDEYFEVVFAANETRGEVKMKVLAEKLLDFRIMQGQVLQTLHLVVPQPKVFEWQEFVLGLAAKIRRVEVPKEFNVEASIKSLIIQYATSRTLGTKLEDLIVKKPVKQEDRVLMRHKDIQEEIGKRRFPGYIDNLEMSVVLNDLQGTFTVVEVGGEKFAVFSIPDPKINPLDIVASVATDFETKY